MTLLAIDELSVEYPGGARAVRGVSLRVADGECLAVIGESGSGKTSIALAALGLLPAAVCVSGSVQLAGNEMLGTRERTRCALRGRVAGFVAQDPFAAFDATQSVARHIGEAWRAHGLRPGPGEVAALLDQVGIDDAEQRARQRPHTWSGGMLQRAQIAAASALRPPLLIADEPTSALDAARTDEILALIRARARAVLLISHDIRAVRAHATHIAVVYAGRVVEHIAADELSVARHPYTRALLAAAPQPGAGLPAPLSGQAPSPVAHDAGCAFAARCPRSGERCSTEVPALKIGVACHHPS